MEGIFNPNQKKAIFNQAINKDNFDITYTMSGKGDKAIENGPDEILEYKDKSSGKLYKPYERNMAAARHLKISSLDKFFIKTGDNGIIFDPRNKEHIQQCKNSRNGIPIFKMTEVSKTRFDNYMEFLKTKKNRFYTQSGKVF